MGLRSIWKRIGSAFKPSDRAVTHGYSGTPFFQGHIDSEFTSELMGLAGLKKFDEMRKTDGTVKSLLAALTAPLLSGNWYLDGSKKNVREDVMEYCNKAMFEHISFYEKLEELLNMFVYGFWYFEKIFGYPEGETDGRIYWLDIESRHPFAHYKWETEQGYAGVTQWINGYQPTRYNWGTKNMKNPNGGYMSIPAEKLMLFVNDQEADNLNGVSTLRYIYIHYKLKNTFYQIQAIAAERWGVGFPVLKYKNKLKADVQDEVEDWLSNITSGEQTYGMIPDDWNLEIVTGAMAQLKDAIDHHDLLITRSILADWLNVVGSSTGSFAMVAEKIKFFSDNLYQKTRKISAEWNCALKELVRINFGEGVDAPTLEVNGIENQNYKELAEIMQILIDAGLIEADEEILKWIRDTFSLPAFVEGKTIKAPKKDKKEPDDDEPEEAETPEEREERIKNISKDIILESKKKTVETSKREDAFVRAITQNEKHIQGVYYSRMLPMAVDFEQRVKRDVSRLYKRAKIERKNGRDVIALSGNSGLMKGIFKTIDLHAKRWEKQVMSKSLMRDLFTRPSQFAAEVIANEKIFEASLPQILNHFLLGFASNIEAVLYNSPRQMKESIEVNFSGGVTLEEAMKQLDTLEVNKNIYKLSGITHARGLFKNLIYRHGIEDGYEFFKMVIPDPLTMAGKEIIPSPDQLSPSGDTAKWLFLILSLAEWNRRTDDSNSAPVSGLGIHHNSFEYYLPVRGDQMESEKKISAEQRKELLPEKP